MTQKIYSLLADLYVSGGIPFWIFDENAQEIASFPRELSGILKDDTFLSRDFAS